MDRERPTTGKPEAIILANGPSLSTLHALRWLVPWDRLFVVGVNQSWRLFPEPDIHVVVDHDQIHIPEAADFYQGYGGTNRLYHLGSAGELGIKIDRHDAVGFGRFPFRKRHRGAQTKAPPLSEDGGVALKTWIGGICTGGSTAYVALQIVAALAQFRRIWIAGLDMGKSGKFTGQKSHSVLHDAMWERVPEDVMKRVRVIAPSATRVLPIVEWPWVGDGQVVEELALPVAVPPDALTRYGEGPCW